MPLILQSKRAVRPSSTSKSSSSRVNKGASEGRTVSRALQVSSSAGGISTGASKATEPQAPQPTGPLPGPGAGTQQGFSALGLLRKVEVSKGGRGCHGG